MKITDYLIKTIMDGYNPKEEEVLEFKTYTLKVIPKPKNMWDV